MDLSNVESLRYHWPELILGGGSILILLLEVTTRLRERLGEIALLIAALALFAVGYTAGSDQGYLFNKMVVLDGFALFFKIVLGLAAIGAIWMSTGSRELQGEHPGEYYSILLASTLGMYYMASSTNLLMAYLALEFVSLTSYILAGFLRHKPRGSEASLKYLIYGGVSSGAMVYGLSLIYGLTGSLDFIEVGRSLGTLIQTPGNGAIIFIALVLSLVGFGYKIAMVPFHQWSPDVYEGAPLPITAFLAVGSKAAGLALLIRFFYPGLSHAGGDGTWVPIAGVDWPSLMVVAAMVTMTVGNLTALRQDNVKRLLAYSSIAHAGYLLMGFVALSDTGLRAMLFYTVVYYLMNLGAFAVLMTVMNGSGGREDMGAFRGLAWRGGALPAAAMLIFCFSLAGLPPFAGFVGKMYLFAAVVEKQMWLLALVAAANSVVGLYYYARIVKAMYLEAPVDGDPVIVMDASNAVLVGMMVLGTIIFGLYWTPVVSFADRSLVFFGS
ncbi:MAG TPA: NADH-quinone oxidoreductase subunit N [Candidatus Limnocylindrales bacterium]|nr:NADH-quinone oxidoreductase subunit N [Candidatus Limnocylindrales bacterium]